MKADKITASEPAEPQSTFARLAALDCGPYIEKKHGLSYLSWAWALDQLLRVDPLATWSYGEPTRHGGGTMMVSCTVTAFGTARTMQLPVMDHRNKAIANPDAFAVNTAMQRCLVKAIALHGIGLYIYAGEDVPRGEATAPAADDDRADELAERLQDLRDAAINGTEALKAAWGALSPADRRGLAGELASLKAAAAKAGEVSRAP